MIKVVLVFIEMMFFSVKLLYVLKNLIIKLGFKSILIEKNDFADVHIFFLQFLVMTSALKGIAGRNKCRHFLIELIASPFLFRFHFFLVMVKECNIPHMFLFRPFTTIFTTNIIIFSQARKLLILTVIFSIHHR